MNVADRSRIIAFTGFVLAFIAAIEVGLGHTVDPEWLGYGAVAAIALALATVP